MNLAIEFPASSIVLGMITGVGYGLLSTGMVIVYRSNRIINFAHGEIGALGAAVFVVLVVRLKVPYYVTLPLGLAAGAGVAALAEVLVIRRLRRAPRLMSLVATLGLGQLLVAFTLAIATAARGSFPAPPGLPAFEVGSFIVHPSASGLLFLSPIVVVGLTVFLRKSRFGLALRSAAANPEAARMAGVSATRMSTLAWALGGALSAFTAILVAPTLPGGLLTAASFGPRLLMRGLTGAIIARMTNIPVALASGVGVGVVEGLLLRNFRSGGIMDMALFGIILVALLFQFRAGAREEEKGSVWATIQPWRPLPDELAKLWPVRNLGWILAGFVVVPMAVAPLFLSNVTSVTLTGLLGIVMVALSVGIITGLGGHLTLGQFAFAAVGATISAQIAARSHGNPLSLLVGGVVAAVLTIVIGLPALRIRGLFLAVTTLAFAVAMSNWILIQPWALEDGISAGRPAILGRAIEPGRGYYYFALVVFLLLFLISRNVRKTGFGRLLVAVRDNEDAARAFALPTRRIKIQGFLLAGFVAGVGGAAYGHSYSEIGAGQFAPQFSVDVVLMCVIGGIGILAGPLLGVLLVKGIPAFIPLQSLALFTQRFGLLLLILYFPGGLVQLVAPVRERLVRWIGRTQGVIVDSLEQPDLEETAVFTRSAQQVGATQDGKVVSEAVDFSQTSGDEWSSIDPGKEILRVNDVRKRYGGLIAVDDVSLVVNEGETLGLIGPNGAGKTTLFEVLAGFVPADQGRVYFQGEEITTWTPEKRAEAGLIRSIQDVTLFPTLTVLETVQLALERGLRTRFVDSFFGFRDRDKRREAMAREVVGSMGLWSFRNKQIQELSTGTRRITEIACMVALGPKLMLLDEPSSGIAQRETEALGNLLEQLKAQHQMTLLVIEHDIPLIMGLSNRIIAMDAGSVIASGSPEEVRNNSAVVEAYLGGRIEAIERSGALTGGDSDLDLEAISGLGPTRRAALLEAFGSVDAIRKASVDELSKVPGVGRALAEKVHQQLS